MSTLIASLMTALLWASVASAQEPSREVSEALQVEINRAIDRGVEHLLLQQHRDGSWAGSKFDSYPAGPTAFTAFALVESGVSPDSPAIQLALDYLKRNPPRMTYSAGALLLLLAELGDEEHEDWAQQTVDQLVAWESGSLRGAWSYPSGPVDLSNTQFVALGFWAANRLGLEVPVDICKRMAETTIESHQEQTRDEARGFTYFPLGRQRPATGSMTCAGICILQIAREIHGRKLGGKLARAMEDSEEAAMKWLEANWTLETNPGQPEGGQSLYYLYAIERVATFYGLDRLFETDWYAEGARRIVDHQEDNGAWGQYHESCYSLLFLNRASRSYTSEGPTRGGLSTLRSDVNQPAVIRAVPGLELVAWLDQAPKLKLAQIQSVEWWVQGERVKEQVADSTPSALRDFALRWRAPKSGDYEVVAKIQTKSGQELASAPLKVVCQWTAQAWMEAAQRDRIERVPMEAANWTVAGSSELRGYPVTRLMDGWQGTAWLVDSSDAQPKAEFTAEKAVRARQIVFCQPGSAVAALAVNSGVTKVAVLLNGKTRFEFELPSESAGPIVCDFGKRIKVREFTVEILEPKAAKAPRLGLAEIWLQDVR